MIKQFYNYIEDVKSGKVITCIEIQQAVQRFENDLKRTDIYFDEEKALRAIKFISHLKHFTGKFNNINFKLEPWQLFIVANIFGWINNETGLRRFTDAYIEIGRKNGKTQLSAAISLYALIADGEANAEVVLAANSREQAKICFNAVSKFSRKLDPKGNYLKPYRNEIKFGDNMVKVVASDSTRLDGLNCSCVVLDEYHASKTSEVYDVLKSSQAMRTNPLFLIITTAGFNKKSPCYSIRQTAKDVLSNLKIDDAQFIAIFTLDEDDDYRDPKNWIKANPNLNITVNSSFLKSEIIKAKNNVSLETGILTKNFNIWCDTLTTWIPDNVILRSNVDLSLDEIPPDAELICGVDLSSNTDITSITYMYVFEEKYYFINKYYLPEDSLNSVQDKLYYIDQYKKGNLIITPGNVVDYAFILDEILRVHNTHPIHKLVYDAWNSTQFIVMANDNYLNTESYSQTIANFNRPTKEFERLILNNNNLIYMDNNEITRWMFSNVYLRYDSNGNCKPDKSNNTKKVDGVISILQCLGWWLNEPHWNIQVL